MAQKEEDTDFLRKLKLILDGENDVILKGVTIEIDKLEFEY